MKEYCAVYTILFIPYRWLQQEYWCMLGLPLQPGLPLQQALFPDLECAVQMTFYA